MFSGKWQLGSQLKLLPSRDIQESLLNCVEEGTKMVISLVDGSLSEGQSRSFYNHSTRSKLKPTKFDHLVPIH